MKIYIVVDVWYDHYRFQENLYASADLQKCVDWCEERNIIPLRYAKNDKQENSLNVDKIDHYWIQEIDD